MSWKIFAPRTFTLVPFRMGGTTSSGIYIQHDTRLAVIYGRVTSVHPTCQDVLVGDWVLYLPERPVRLPGKQGNTYLLDERLVLGIVKPGDGDVWFREGVHGQTGDVGV